MNPVTDDLPDHEALVAFALKLEAFAATCDARERRILATLVLASMDPVERMRWLAPADLFTDREEAFLHALEAEQVEAP